MKNLLRFCLTTTMVSFTASQANAAPAAVQAGLWQYNESIKTPSGAFEKAMLKAREDLASLPAEQRKLVEKDMADNGIDLKTDGMLRKICINAEDAAHGSIPVGQGNCTQKTVSRQGSTSKVSFSCKDSTEANGTADLTVLSPTHFKAQVTVNTKQSDGKPERLNITQEGKWLSADCAGIRPAYTP